MNINTLQNSSANILIVDGTPDHLDLLSAILKKRGYETRCAVNGATALEIAQSGWAQLILLDIQLPDISGYEVCQKLKAEGETREIPIIFVSALDDFADQKKAFAVGGVDYITKPFQAKEIIVRVANQLAISAAKAKMIQLTEQLEQKVKERTIELEAANQELQLEIAQRKQAQERIMRMALYDSVTGLANRNSFVNRLEKAIQITAQKPNYFFAVLLLECDRFRAIKRSIAHIEENKLLKAIGERIAGCLPKSALISRFEGEEFAVFLDNIKDVKEVTNLAQQIQKKFIKPFNLQRRKFSIDLNVGIAIGNQDYQATDRLLNDADIALQKAISLGNRECQVFAPQMYIQLHLDMDFSTREVEIKQALQRQEFVNYYLPIVSLASRKVVGLETLVRWQHPQEGLLLPKDFIIVAEETGLMIPIGDQVIKQAAYQLQSWQQRHSNLKDLFIAINLSAKELFHHNLVTKFDYILRKTKLQGHNLKLEIAETAIMEDETLALEILQQLQTKQIQLSLDNFGTGYSSLTHVHTFPFNSLKIDYSLINKIDKDNRHSSVYSSNLRLVEQIINISHQMGMTAIAEGIETEYQWECLSNLGCDFAEGHLISQVLPSTEIEKLWAVTNTTSV